MKRIVCLLLIVTLFLIPCSSASAWTCFRNEEGRSGANTIQATTPIDTNTTGPRWKKRFSKSMGPVMNSTPVITEKNIYIVSKNVLYKTDKEGTVLSTLQLCASMNSMCHMASDRKNLYIPLGGGLLQCVDMNTMTSVWTSESFGGQSLTTVYIHNGLVYAGTTNGDGTEGYYYCVGAEDGKTRWSYQNETYPCGYYWSGAVSATLPAGECLLFGGDNGILVSHSLASDQVYDTLDLSSITGSKGKIRAGITYDAASDAFYTTSNNGYLYQIRIGENGKFDRVNSVFLGDSSDKTVNCTSTPTIYNGRIYVCSYYDNAGRISVIDADTMHTIYAATTGTADIKSSPLVSTGYATEENHHRVYVYFTQNTVPGGIYYIEDSSVTESADIKTLYEPKNNPQFCLHSLAADAEGTLYYSNDSGTFFAVHEGFASGDILPPPSPTTPADLPADSTVSPVTPADPTGKPGTSTVSSPFLTPDPQQMPPGTTPKKKIRPGKPSRIRIIKKKKHRGKYKVTLSWKKGNHSKKTQIKIKGKKLKTVSVSKYTLSLKKGVHTILLYGYISPSQKSSAARIRFRVS